MCFLHSFVVLGCLASCVEYMRVGKTMICFFFFHSLNIYLLSLFCFTCGKCMYGLVGWLWLIWSLWLFNAACLPTNRTYLSLGRVVCVVTFVQVVVDGGVA